MEIWVKTTYEITNYTKVELPDGRTIDEVEKITMRDGKGSIKCKDLDVVQYQDYFDDELHKKIESVKYYWVDLLKSPTQISFSDELDELK